MLLRAVFNRVLSISKDGECTASLGVCPRAWPLSQWRSFYLVSNRNILAVISVASSVLFSAYLSEESLSLSSCVLSLFPALTWTNSSLSISSFYLETQNYTFLQMWSCKFRREQKKHSLWSAGHLVMFFSKNKKCSDSSSKSDAS